MKKNYFCPVTFLFFFSLFFTADTFAVLKTWNGSGGTSWGTSASWTPAGVPTSSDDVVIPGGTPSCNTGNVIRSCMNLTVNSGGTLIVSTGVNKYLDVYGNIAINGTLDHTGSTSIFMNGTNKTLGGTGSFLNTWIYFWSPASTTITNNLTLWGITIGSTASLSLGANTLTITGYINQTGYLNLGTGMFVDKIFGQTLTPAKINHQTGTFMWDITGKLSNGTWNVYDTDYHSVRFACDPGFTISLDAPSVSPNLTLGGNLTIDPNTTLSATSGIGGATPVFIKGNWINNGTYIPSTGTVTFNGTAAGQTIGGSSATTFYGLSANHSSTGITLNQPTSVSSGLTLTNGIIYSDATNLLIVNDNATSTSGNEGSFVDGPMRKTGNDAFVFPVGDGTIWARIGISAPGSATDHFTAQYYDASYSSTTPVAATIAYVSTVEHWILDRTNGASNVNVTLYWENGTRSGINTFSGDLHVARWDGTTWQDHGSAAMTGNAAAGTVRTSAVVSSFSPFTFSSISSSVLINPLPIELLDFSSECNTTGTKLSWSTSSETGNDFFTLERTPDGSTFREIGKVKGAGNSTIVNHYSFTDLEAPEDQVYYRLKQTDFDGNISYGPVISSVCKSKETRIDIFPNPSSGKNIYLNISGMKENEKWSVTLIDISGKILSRKEIAGQSGNMIMTLSGHGLEAGIYQAVVQNETKVFTEKFVVK